MISVVFQNKGHPVDRAEEKLHCLAQALFFLNFSFPSYVTTANPVEQILVVEAEGIKINFDHSKYFCWGGGWCGRSRAVFAGIVSNN